MNYYDDIGNPWINMYTDKLSNKYTLFDMKWNLSMAINNHGISFSVPESMFSKASGLFTVEC